MSDRPVINLSQQISRLRAVVASGIIGGIAAMSGIILIGDAIIRDPNSMAPLMFGGVSLAAAVFFVAYAIGAAGRVIECLDWYESVIYTLGTKTLAQDSVITALRLRASVESAHVPGAEDGDAIITPSSVIPFNKLN